GFDKAKVISWLNQEGLTDSLSEHEKRLIFEGVGQPDRFKVQVESMWALAWAMEITNELNFNAFAPAALAGIGSLPATLRDRSILIPLVAAEEGQLTTSFDQLHTETENILARKLARWASDNFSALAAC